MPLMLGGIWNRETPAIRQLVHRLQAITAPQIEGEAQTISTGFMLTILGRQKGEMEFFPISTSISPSFATARVGHIFGSNEHINTEKIFHSKGEYLSRFCWGRYLYLISEVESGTTLILPEPLGMMPLYYIQVPGGLLFCNYIWPLRDLLPEQTSLDQSYLVTYLNFGSICTRKTPFQKIYSTLPTEGLLVRNGVATIQPFWDPTRSINEKFSSDQLAPCFVECVGKWGEISDQICIDLSGGLDSTSLLLAATHTNQNKKEIIAINYSNSNFSEYNESAIAKKVADLHSIPLFTHYNDTPFSFDSLPFSLPRWDRPDISILTRENNSSALEKKYQNLVFWSGDGGDPIFIEDIPSSTLADCIIDRKFRQFIPKLYELSQLRRESMISLFRETTKSLLSYYVGRYEKDELGQKNLPFLTTTAASLLDIDFLSNMTWSFQKALKPGKRDQLTNILINTTNLTLGAHDEKFVTLYPFYSQPLVELAISMPAYDSFNSQYTRFPFRQSISKFFSSDLVWRRSKGSSSGLILNYMRDHAPRIREISLEGYCSSQNFIHRPTLEKQIQLATHGMIEPLWGLLHLISLELWIETWDQTI